MNRLFVCGDTHRTIDIMKIASINFPIQNELDKSDILVICGDWGCIWGETDDKNCIDYYENKPWTTFVVFGNHENYNLIEQYPIVDFKGGKARKISNSVYAEIRGEIYDFFGLKALCLGGADSTDKHLREPNISWWEQESITQNDIIRAEENLKKINYQVNLVFSHTGGTDVCNCLNMTQSLSDSYLGYIFYLLDKKNINYKHYCGHYHCDKSFINHHILYNKIIEIMY